MNVNVISILMIMMFRLLQIPPIHVHLNNFINNDILFFLFTIIYNIYGNFCNLSNHWWRCWCDYYNCSKLEMYIDREADGYCHIVVGMLDKPLQINKEE